MKDHQTKQMPKDTIKLRNSIGLHHKKENENLVYVKKISTKPRHCQGGMTATNKQWNPLESHGRLWASVTQIKIQKRGY